MKYIFYLVAIIATFFIGFTIGAVFEKEINKDIEPEIKYVLVEVEWRNDYYALEKGEYYIYNFDLKDTNVELKIGYRSWFTLNEKYEVGDILLLVYVDNKLTFIRVD